MDPRRGERSLFLHRVRDLVRREPVTCDPGTPVAALAARMERERTGSVIVVDGGGRPVGIVTDRDLRRKVVAEARDVVTTTAAQIMSAPLVTIRPAAFAFEAVVEMTRREIRHLGVLDDGRLVGVVSSHDVFVLHAAHPVMLAREIAMASSPDALAPIARRMTSLVGRLLDEGAGAYELGHIVAELNDRLVVRVLGLTAEALEAEGEQAPPGGYCWIALGSEARREQTLRTDQDNGLVYADPPADLAEPVARYYRRLGEEAIRGLVRVGFPPCPGDVMASNPRWCRPLSVWAGYFRDWMATASPANILAASIHFDLRPLVGAIELAESLRQIIRAEAPGHGPFLGTIARDVATRSLPLGLFGNLRVARRGPHRGGVDIKGGGALALVGAARLHALQLGLAETNTVDRLRAAASRGAFGEGETVEITDAFLLLMRLRLRHQLAQLARGETPDNFVTPETLSHADVLLLRDALHTVRRLQAAIRQRFATDFVL